MVGSEGERFAVRFDGGGVLASAFGIGPKASWVSVDPKSMTVRMGWMLFARIPRASIQSAVEEEDPDVVSRGVHGFRGKWLVNGSADGIVRFEIDPPVRARTAIFPLRVHTLQVSMADPRGLLDAVGSDIDA